MSNNRRRDSKAKINFVFCGGIGGGQHTLQGLVDYLSEAFNVFYFELPGLGLAEKPLSRVSIKTLSENVEKRLSGLNLDSYILAGGSFVFRVINEIPFSNKCLGIVGVVPYINSTYLKLPKLKILRQSLQLGLVSRLKLHTWLWNSLYFRRVLLNTYGEEALEIILKECDRRTFFESVRIVLSDKSEMKLSSYPYAIILSKNDSSIKFDQTIDFFRQNASKLLIFESEMEHYPINANKDYFEESLPKSILSDLVEYFTSQLEAKR